MATTRYTGKNLVVEWKKGAGPAVALTADGRSFEFTHDQETADGTAGADEYRVELKTVKMASASMELLMNSSAAWVDDLQLGDEGELTWYPEGKTAGKPVWGMSALVKKMSQSLPYDDVAKFSLEWANTGSTLLHEGEAYVAP
jgi:hypothetical protein